LWQCLGPNPLICDSVYALNPLACDSA
jgi:hypothetical protein